MLRFMDWSVVAMGCVLVLLSLASRWWERTEVRKGRSPDQGMRFFGAWLPLLVGLGLVGARMPSLLVAPHPVIMIADTLDGALWVTVLILVLRAVRRGTRARSPRNGWAPPRP
ncbi:hypothetical protein GQF42_16510 [Streptomyces broussonetiae]|uniref:Uncharacterized protein n=1 Tax=Streptomyces broussonetiae TaxID=2686304 RepID=A0A6I6N3R0_9ACTN|nr:hypothetical protein [Streptomyces broussonetiae]QHA04680.1 hypothetical protein GQF42_16510 [Streptomyces broussonetiae]